MRILPSYHEMQFWVFFAVGASVTFLGTALISQYFFGLHPCELCIKQRIPYAIIAGLGAVFLWPKWSEKALKYVVLLCIALFLVDAGIAIYHAGIEAGVFVGPSSCTTSAKGPQTLEEMRAEIMGAELVPCDQPMEKLLGLSMAAWNAVAALTSAVMLSWGYRHVAGRANKAGA